MTMRAIAAVAALALSAAACNPSQTASLEDQAPVDQPAPDPAADPAFVNAMSFQCEGGGKVDVVFQPGSSGSALARVDGGAAVTLMLDESAASGMKFKDEAGAITFDADIMQVTRDGGKTCAYVSRALSPPVVDGVVRNLDAEDAGASVELKVGEKMTVSLSGVPTAGYVWGADEPPAFIKVSEGPGGATSTDQYMPGFAGGNHWEVLVIEALAPGEGEISLVQKRPWEERAAPDDQRFKFQLKVN